MNSDEDDASAMKALAKEHDLSIRGAIATKPPFSYMRAFFDAMMDPHDADANEADKAVMDITVADRKSGEESMQMRMSGNQTLVSDTQSDLTESPAKAS